MPLLAGAIAGAAPAIAPTVAAAITSFTRCDPSRWIASSGTSLVVAPVSRSTIQPPSIAVPDAIDAPIANSRVCARPLRANSRTAGSSALITFQSLASWFSNTLAFAAPYASTLEWRSRWSGEKFSITAIHG